jgi:hypothetical protein
VAVDDPFNGTEFIVLEFNPSTAGVSVLASDRGGMRHTGYSDTSRGDAVQDAREAADRARARPAAALRRGPHRDRGSLPPRRVTGRVTGRQAARRSVPFRT